MHLPSLSFEDAHSIPELRVVDVRSPAEFAADHIPGASSVPLFEDAQRALIGALYCQESPAAALTEGLGLVRRRLNAILHQVLGCSVPEEDLRAKFDALAPLVQELEVQKISRPAFSAPILVHCWRGGQRSRALVALLRGLGFDEVFHLDQGYKGYRAWVRERLNVWRPEFPLIVLRGATGVGKTRLLQELEEKKPGTTFDLEGMAGHRSSILGSVGMEPVSQKRFESLLVARMEEMVTGPCFVEGESRKIGNRLIPPTLFAAMEAGQSVRITAPQSQRVLNLVEDYQGDASCLQDLRAQLPFLENRLGPKWAGHLIALLDQGQAAEVAQVLLERYYDPLYGHSDRRRCWAGEFSAEDPDVVVSLLAFRELPSSVSATS